jgi:hypothetical protein
MAVNAGLNPAAGHRRKPVSLTRRTFFTTPVALGGVGLANAGIAPHATNGPTLRILPLLVMHNGTRQGTDFLSGAAAGCAGLHRAPPQSLEISLRQAGAFAGLQEKLHIHAGLLTIGLLEQGQMRLAEQAMRACGAGLFFSAGHTARQGAVRHRIVINSAAQPVYSSKLLEEAAADWPFALGQLLAGAPLSPRRQQAPSAGESYSLVSFAAVL